MFRPDSRPAFKVVTPPNAQEVISNRRGSFDSLFYDTGSFKRISPVYFESNYSARYWVEFLVNGKSFRRSVREESVGNHSVLWVRICGIDLQIYPV